MIKFRVLIALIMTLNGRRIVLVHAFSENNTIRYALFKTNQKKDLFYLFIYFLF